MKTASWDCENDIECVIRSPSSRWQSLSADSPQTRLKNGRGPGVQASPAPRRCCCTARATPCCTPRSRAQAWGRRTPGAPGDARVRRPASLRGCRTPAELPGLACRSRGRCGWPAAAAARRRPATAGQRPSPRLHSGPARPQQRAPVPRPHSAAARGGDRRPRPQGRPCRRCWTSWTRGSGGGGCGCTGQSSPGARHCCGCCGVGCDRGADAAPAQGPREM